MVRLLKVMLKMLFIYMLIVSVCIFIVDRVNGTGEKSILRCMGESVSFTYNKFDEKLSEKDIDLGSGIDKVINNTTKVGEIEDFNNGKNE